MTRTCADRSRRAGRPELARALSLAGLMLCLSQGQAAAQTKGCDLVDYSDPPRSVLSCNDGFKLTAEKGAAYTLVDENRDGRPDAVDLKSKAVLIEYPPRRRGGFQVRTPYAIASVRGTTWIVDATPSASAVLVQDGRVRVSGTRGGSEAVFLGAGDGVDVGPGREPLVPKPWSRERQLHLLARFGR